MADVAALLEQRSELSARPQRYEGLLIRPIMNGSETTGASAISYDGWEDDHIAELRFYVVGMNAFKKATQLDATKLFAYRDEAHRRILDKTTWLEGTDNKAPWKKELGKPQISKACNGGPVSFIKGAQLLMVCEIAVEALLDHPKPDFELPEGLSEPEHIHRRMALLPAVWNINDFNEDYLKAVREQYGDAAISKLTEELELGSTYVVSDLTRGFTTTFETATRIHKYATDHLAVPGRPLGQVRAKPGKRKLGTKSASENEVIDLK